MRWSKLTLAGVSLIAVGLGSVLYASVAFGHAVQAGTSDATAYGSDIGHSRTIRIQLMNSLRNNWSFMETDYNNGNGHLILETNGYTVGQPIFVNNLPGDPQEPDIWVVEAGTSDEGVLNIYYGFDGCSSTTAWGKTYAVSLVGSSPHRHTLKQKLCIWPSRIGGCGGCGGRLGVNGQGLRWQYLTMQHEMSHALNLAHPSDSHGALMRDGGLMLELNSYERTGIRGHY